MAQDSTADPFPAETKCGICYGRTRDNRTLCELCAEDIRRMMSRMQQLFMR